MGKKKNKITYIDDNSTIADMSRVNRKGEKREPPPPRPKSSFKDKWDTYWHAVKQMFIPMCIVLCILCVLFLILMWLGGNF